LTGPHRQAAYLWPAPQAQKRPEVPRKTGQEAAKRPEVLR